MYSYFMKVPVNSFTEQKNRKANTTKSIINQPQPHNTQTKISVARLYTFLIPIMFSLSSVPIARTASTTMDAKNSFSPPISFDDRVVAAHFASKLFFSSKLFPSMLTANSFTFSIAYIINMKLLNKL